MSENNWCAIYKAWWPNAVQLAEKWCCDRFAAEDIAQDIFLRLMERNFDMSAIDNMESYLFTAVRNRSSNYRRDRKKSVYLSLEEVEHLSSVAPLVETRIACLDIHRAVAHALPRLAPRQRQALLLKMQGAKSSDLAHTLGLKTNTAKSLANETRLACIKHIGYLRQEGSAA